MDEQDDRRVAPPATLHLDHVSAATRLLEKRKQMLEVQQALDAQKTEYHSKDEHLKRREDNLRKKDLELQEALVLFNKFLKENEAKRRRAERRAQDEVRQTEQKLKEIEGRQDSLDQLRNKCAKLKDEVAANESYQIFLRQVQAENVSEYPDVEAILTRYYCLIEAHRDLMEKQRAITEQLEAKRNEYIQYTQDHHQMNLAFNNDIARFSKALEEAQKTAIVVEERLDTQLKAESARTLKISQIMMAVDNLFNRCKKASTILNHTKTLEVLGNPNSQGPMGAKAKRSGGTDGKGTAEGGPAEGQSASAQPNHLEQTAVQTSMRLDVVASYLLDFADIHHKYGVEH